MAEIAVNGSRLGNALNGIMEAEDIAPGDVPSYEVAKTIWLYHPLGKKMVEGPIAMAQSQPREISVPKSPEDRCRDAFVKQWEKDGCDEIIYQVVSISRAYGIGTLAVVSEGVAPNEPLEPKKLADMKIAWQAYDPLNTAGSLVLNQDPLSIDFMKVTGVAVSGIPFHRSRTVTIMNERPVYIAYTSSAFGFVGRSVFQRALFPLKSFIQSMVTDDLITKKAGVFIAMLKTAGAIIDAIMQASAGLKRLFVKQATNGNVISIGTDEKIETLNMQNIDGAFGMARKDILENIATAADMPAIILKQETFAEGFGEGTEDAKLVAGYVAAFRRHIRPVYDFLDPIIQRRAWNPDFYAVIQSEYPEYRNMDYETAFYQWQESFAAVWPNLLTEPDSEKVKADDVKLKAILAALEIFGPMMDPENKATLVGWAQDNMNENKIMFQTPLLLNLEELAEYVPPQQVMAEEGEGEEPAPPKPLGKIDSVPAGLPGLTGRKLRKMTAEQLDDLLSILAEDPEGLPRPDGAGLPFVTGVTSVTKQGPKRDRAEYMRNYRAQKALERLDA